MYSFYQKRSDIIGLQKLMHELNLSIDIGADDLIGYETPDYEAIKHILEDNL